uniref:Protein argonaute-2 n=1 Tax=Glossina pallidipes TaxID=7398 RepID=A0A1A9ZIK1_GLOPL
MENRRKTSQTKVNQESKDNARNEKQPLSPRQRSSDSQDRQQEQNRSKSGGRGSQKSPKQQWKGEVCEYQQKVREEHESGAANRVRHKQDNRGESRSLRKCLERANWDISEEQPSLQTTRGPSVKQIQPWNDDWQLQQTRKEQSQQIAGRKQQQATTTLGQPSGCAHRIDQNRGLNGGEGWVSKKYFGSADQGQFIAGAGRGRGRIRQQQLGSGDWNLQQIGQSQSQQTQEKVSPESWRQQSSATIIQQGTTAKSVGHRHGGGELCDSKRCFGGADQEEYTEGAWGGQHIRPQQPGSGDWNVQQTGKGQTPQNRQKISPNQKASGTCNSSVEESVPAYKTISCAGIQRGTIGRRGVVDGAARTKTFEIQIKETGVLEVDLASLRSYHNERVFDKPMRALQALEVVLASNNHALGIRSGRSFYRKPDEYYDLGDGYEMYTGIYQAAILGEVPLLNVDISHKSFPKPQSLVQCLKDYKIDPRHTMEDSRTRKFIQQFLKGICITYTPPPSFGALPKIYKVLDINDAPARITFKMDDGKETTVKDYFTAKGCLLQYPSLNCITAGTKKNEISLPMEFCSVAENQLLNRKDGSMQVTKMIKYAATSTDERKKKIMNLLRHFCHSQNPTIRDFGVQLGSNFIKINFRLLPPPDLEYYGGKTVRPCGGAWQVTNAKFLESAKVQRGHKWAIIYENKGRPSINVHVIMEFKKTLQRISQDHGVRLADQCEVTDFHDIERTLESFARKGYALVVVIIPSYGASYSMIKQKAELRVGILTQCIKEKTVSRACTDMSVMRNLMLKLNAKLNGTNHKVAEEKEAGLRQLLQSVRNVMFIGADVTHPSPDQRHIPSVVGVAASHDAHGACYNTQYSLQKSTVENIEDMKSIIADVLGVYKSYQGRYPDHIIYYRDGVSDGQFPIVRREELRGIRHACAQLGCRAKVTCIVVVKRHHTRFFPLRQGKGGRDFNNVEPGTVVDQYIVHPNEKQFFLVSHKAIQGTARPTRYNIIEDDANFDIDLLQKLTYNMCHMFPRCNMAVSYPAPAYLAHLAAFRGRVYLEGNSVEHTLFNSRYTALENSNMSKQQKCQPYVIKVGEHSTRDFRHKTSNNRPPVVRQARTSSDDNANGSNEMQKGRLKGIVVLNKITENKTVPLDRIRVNADHLACGDQSIRPNKSNSTDQTQTKTSQRFLEGDRCVVIKTPKMYTKPRETESGASHVEKLHSGEGDNCRRVNKWCSYLLCSQNPIRKITPISEETEQDLAVDDLSTNHQKPGSVLDCLSIKSCWLNDQAESEIFHTNTVVRRKAANTNRRETMSTPPITTREEQNTSTSPITVSEKCEISSPRIVAIEKARTKFKHQEVQTVSWTSLKSSQHENIFLQSYGSLVTTNNDSDDYALECMQRNKVPSRKRSKFRNFCWLLRPFHGKYKKSKKSSEIQAVVYKTYFVKWTKPPETLINGFGVRRNEAVRSSVLRRCRSAIF